MANKSTLLAASVQAVQGRVGSYRLRAVDYLRVSTEEQKKGYGVASQGKKTAGYIANKDWHHVDTYIDDGVSGSLESEARPRLNCLMKDAHNHEFDVVVVKEGRAIGRTGRAFWRWVWALEDIGIFVAIVDGDIDNTSPEGRREMRRQADYAETEWETIRTRTQDGLQEKALEGGWWGGIPPYGRRIENQGKKGLSRLVTDEGEGALLRDVWKLYVVDDLNWRECALRLNSQKRYRRDGQPWSHQGVRRVMLLDSTLDAKVVFRHPDRKGVVTHPTKLGPDGKPLYGETVGVELEPIFTSEEMKMLKAAIARKSRNPMKGDHSYPLSRRLFNGHEGCGKHYVGTWRSRTGARRYRCSGKEEKHAGSIRCNCPPIEADAVESRVWREVCTLFQSPERLNAMADEWLEITSGQENNHSERIAELDNQIAIQNRAIAAVMAAAAKEAAVSDAPNPGEAIKQATHVLNKELQALGELRSEAIEWQAETEASKTLAQDLRALSVMATDQLLELPAAEQGKFLALWDVKVTITGPAPDVKAGQPCKLAAWFEDNNRPVPDSLTDSQWAKIEGLMPGKARSNPHKQLIDGILFKARTGVRWVDLPLEFGNQATIHTRCAKWLKSGMWDRIMEQLPADEGSPVAGRVTLPPMRVEGRVDPRYWGAHEPSRQDSGAKTERPST